MLAISVDNFNDLKKIIENNISKEKDKKSCVAMKKQFIKDFLNKNIDDNNLLKIADNYKKLNITPPHIIPQKHNLTYIIKYNIIKILSQDNEVEI